MLTALKKRWDENTKDLGPREVALTIIDDLERYLPAYLGLAADRRPVACPPSSLNTDPVLKLARSLR